jgi:hypothetical protein
LGVNKGEVLCPNLYGVRWLRLGMHRRQREITRREAAYESSGEGKDKSQIPIAIAIHEVSSVPMIALLALSLEMTY